MLRSFHAIARRRCDNVDQIEAGNPGSTLGQAHRNSKPRPDRDQFDQRFGYRIGDTTLANAIPAHTGTGDRFIEARHQPTSHKHNRQPGPEMPTDPGSPRRHRSPRRNRVARTSGRHKSVRFGLTCVVPGHKSAPSGRRPPPSRTRETKSAPLLPAEGSGPLEHPLHRLRTVLNYARRRVANARSALARPMRTRTRCAVPRRR
jgi:hypothetical protein